MIVGVPREIKNNEYRVGLTPAGVHTFVAAGHKVIVEAGAGLGCGILDADYEEAGANLVAGPQDIYGNADMVIKVKEPLEPEFSLIRAGQVVYTYFHFAADETLTLAMRDRGAVCIAYETMTNDGRTLPLLTPMSEVAGRMSVQEGAKYLERPTE
ncbi:MAG: alanine dehydrogenase, partial [Planctomycetes bacterium]|nr:alanine dehydrogenase [Planctomycetota bacterium]